MQPLPGRFLNRFHRDCLLESELFTQNVIQITVKIGKILRS